jgi:hypothetical protein
MAIRIGLKTIGNNPRRKFIANKINAEAVLKSGS